MDSVTNNIITIGELARLSGLTTHTLRYYESAGVLKPARRAANGHRRYNSSDILWLEFVLKLKLTGMPLAEIRQYAELRSQGETTLNARLAMLKLHRERLVTTLSELSECAAALDDKIRIYRTMIVKQTAPSGKKPHAPKPD
jgi:DNA-binding transcriptional MerR regulator